VLVQRCRTLVASGADTPGFAHAEAVLHFDVYWRTRLAPDTEPSLLLASPVTLLGRLLALATAMARGEDVEAPEEADVLLPLRPRLLYLRALATLDRAALRRALPRLPASWLFERGFLLHLGFNLEAAAGGVDTERLVPLLCLARQYDSVVFQAVVGRPLAACPAWQRPPECMQLDLTVARRDIERLYRKYSSSWDAVLLREAAELATLMGPLATIPTLCGMTAFFLSHHSRTGLIAASQGLKSRLACRLSQTVVGWWQPLARHYTWVSAHRLPSSLPLRPSPCLQPMRFSTAAPLLC
jgi:hypothetical protein